MPLQVKRLIMTFAAEGRRKTWDSWTGRRRGRRPRAPPAFAGFTSKEFARDREDNWIDDIPDSNGRSVDAARYAMMDDALRGWPGAVPADAASRAFRRLAQFR